MDDHRIAGAIIALRDERGSYNWTAFWKKQDFIIALRDERGSYNVFVH